MKKLIFLVSLMVCFQAAAPAYSFWIWTPKTGKFVNPKTEPKPTPKEQFEYAKSFFDGKKYDDAARELKKVIKTYPKSVEASEAQYYLGMTEEAQGKLYEAYQAFQTVIEKYPFSERIAEINERIYKIGESFMSGVKRKSMGVVLPVENPAIEIYQKVVDNSTYGPLAPKAQYKLGLVLKGASRYYEAEDAFNKVLSNYPDSEWVEAARFQIASCKASVSRSPDYDQGGAKEAKDKFEEFVREHPDAVLSRDAEKNIQQLNEREAESDYSIALFYEKQKVFESARIYYNNVITNYPDSSWAAKAMERLNILDTGKNKK
ncbi:MAG: outer membrane protein assembly factor BamD [Candidatus Omnitrophica bacterium]|nr:outer membrane protein assembly factor BamD [Candidatus Omnitrophota bacterium]